MLKNTQFTNLSPPVSPCQKRSFNKTPNPNFTLLKRLKRQDSIEKIKKLYKQATNPSDKFHLMVKVAEEALKYKNIEELNNSLKTLSNITQQTQDPSTKFYYQRFLINFYIKIYGINAINYLKTLKNPLLKIELLTKLATLLLLDICNNNWNTLIEYFKTSLMLNEIKKHQNYAKAMQFFKEAEKTAENMNDKNFAYQLIANAYFGIDENQILLNSLRISDMASRVTTLMNIGRNYLINGFSDTARKFFRKANENIPYIKDQKLRLSRLKELQNISTNNLLLLD